VSPSGEDRRKSARIATITFWALSAAAVVAILVAGRAVLFPFLLAILVGYVLFPAVKWVEGRGVPRWAGILLVYVLVIGTIVGSGFIIIPRLFAETRTLSTELPRLAGQFRDQTLPRVDARLKAWLGPAAGTGPEQAPEAEPGPPMMIRPQEDGSYVVELGDEVHVSRREEGRWVVGPRPKKEAFSSQRALQDAFDGAIGYAQKNSLELLAVGQKILSGITRGIFFFGITLMLAGYMMFTWEEIRAFARNLFDAGRHESFNRFAGRLDRGLSGVVRGQLLICVVNGVLSAIGFWLFGLKYWPILSVIATVLSIIPIFGTILSTVPAVIIGLTDGFGTAVGVLVWIIAIHQLEANFLNPKIIGDQAKIHPVLIMLALLMGEHFFRVPGLILAVPTLALVQVIFLHFREEVVGPPSMAVATTAMDREVTKTGDIRTSDTVETRLVLTRRSIDDDATGGDVETSVEVDLASSAASTEPEASPARRRSDEASAKTGDEGSGKTEGKTGKRPVSTTLKSPD